jgi:hypothetical protein
LNQRSERDGTLSSWSVFAISEGQVKEKINRDIVAITTRSLGANFVRRVTNLREAEMIGRDIVSRKL